MTPLLMNALQLESVGPTTFGGLYPLNTYYVTLNPSAASTGAMTITFATPTSGTFTSTLDVNFEINAGSLTGTTVYTGDLTLTNAGDTWSTTPGTPVIPGVNYKLNDTDTSNDFWPGTPLIESHPGQGIHTVMDPSPVPSPSGPIALLGLVVAGLAARVLPRKKQA
jgi:hypothetical protein